MMVRKSPRIQSRVAQSRDLLELAHQIRNHILCDVEDARLRQLGALIIRRFNVPARQPRQLARAFQLYAQQRIRFFREWPEVNAAPWVTARWGIGDCDDKARLVAALCKSFRIPVRLTYATFSTGKRTVSHVWPEVQITKGSDKWTSMETVRPWPLGKSVLDVIERKGWPHRAFALEI